VKRIKIGKVVPIIKDNKREVVMKTGDKKMQGLPGNFSKEDGKGGKDLLLRSKMVGHENTLKRTKMNVASQHFSHGLHGSHGSTRIKIREYPCYPWPCIFRALLCVFVATCICRWQ
jgi:hypothetical protein